MGPDGRLVHAGDDARAARRANPCGGKGMRVSHPFLCQLIEIGRDRMRIAVATQMRTYVLGR